jgi:hypothetical protein
MVRFVAAARVRYYFASRAIPLTRRSVSRPKRMSTLDPRCAKFIDQLDALNFNRRDYAAEEVLDELVDGLDSVDDPSGVFPSVFRFFERNSVASTVIGSPGPLVHFIEKHFRRTPIFFANLSSEPR